MVQNFKFRLQKLLDLRANIEEKCKIEFKQAVNDMENSILKLKQLEDNHFKYNYFNGNENIIEKKIRLNYINALNENIKFTNIEIEKKNKIVDEKREELKKRQIERKTVELLKEKKELLFIKEQNLIEQKNNDEFALYGHIRKNLKGGE